jgi:uncharacterized phiE125 gp8 family phage protein
MSVPLSTIKSALKIDFDDDDNEILRLREAAVSLIERRTQLSLTPVTLPLYLKEFKDALIPAHPFVSVSLVQYRDQLNAPQTMPATDYWLDLTEGTMPVLRFLEVPVIYPGTMVTVFYLAGYTALPNDLVHAIIALVGHWYNNPEAASPISLSTVPLSMGFILDNLSTRSNIR